MNSDPLIILKEAKNHLKLDEYDKALAKLIWFFDHALKIDKGLSGVRLSYCIIDWKTLADKYPPALEELNKRSDQLEVELRRSINIELNLFERGQIQDYVVINQKLNRNDKSVVLFKAYDKINQEVAKVFYIFIRYILESREEYQLCYKYLGDIPLFFSRWARSFKELNQYYRESMPSELDGALNHQIKTINSALKILSKIHKNDESDKLYHDVIDFLCINQHKELITKIIK